MMEKKEIQNKCRGSLVGGAIGDALGYPLEIEVAPDTDEGTL